VSDIYWTWLALVFAHPFDEDRSLDARALDARALDARALDARALDARALEARASSRTCQQSDPLSG
jgi:hypothetical protein